MLASPKPTQAYAPAARRRTTVVFMARWWSEERLRRLRGARYADDGPVLVALLSGRQLEEVLQLAGDAVGRAAADQVAGAAELAEEFARALDQRGWEGDQELAEQLRGVLGHVPAPLLHPLPVDLEELSDLLEGDPAWGGGAVDLVTGECRHGGLDSWEDDEDEVDEEDGDRWLPVVCQGSREGYRDMEEFIAVLDDARFAELLEVAIAGPGAFRRFKDVLARDEEQSRRYYLFAGERQAGRARSWLAEHGYCPAVSAVEPL
ncbi:hypothetical protein [Streptacidiphilus sp. EB103A]|uniref:hypothetical protein n=1 Tax=Streptacidiphilus sp. EB103A TaxID=3156275 RepID=UPI0035183109